MIDFSVLIEQVQDAIDAFKRAIVEAVRALCKILPVIVDFIVETYAKLLSLGKLLGKWWHLYKHAKRRRTRKKYYNKIRKVISASIA